jgi:hypothetical protein
MLGAIRPTGSGGGGAVASVFGRSGAVIAANNDYAASQIAGLGASAGALTITPGTTQTLTAASTIAPNAGVIPIASTSAITLTSNPQIGAGANGQQVTLINIGNNPITLANGNGLILGQSHILYGGRSIQLVYSTAFSSWLVEGIIPESVALTGAPTAPTAAWNTNSDQIATTAQVFNHLYSHDAPGWRPLTLTANWVNFGGAYPAASIKRIGRDMVFIRGVVNVSGSYAGTITTIPVDCRPPAQLIFSNASSVSSGQLLVTTAGNIIGATTLAVGQYQSICVSYSL